jgi:hypothetical protein
VTDAALLAPLQKSLHGVGVIMPCVPVADVGGGKLDEAPGGFLAGAGDRSQQPFRAGSVELAAGNWGEVLGHVEWVALATAAWMNSGVCSS